MIDVSQSNHYIGDCRKLLPQLPDGCVQTCVLAGSRPGDLVLDPFLGSGTVGLVAEKHGRRWVGFDLSYEQLAKERTAQRSLKLEKI